jgi:glucosyl-dolichyl phosphate glucuronosyltransferase
VTAAPTRRGSVVIPTYTDKRWSHLRSAVHSARHQTPPPHEVIVCVDHNSELFERCREEWRDVDRDGAPPVVVAENRYAGHLGASRTTAAEIAGGEFLLFLDDDAVADPGWLERMLATLDDPSVVAVGGAPLPVYAKPRPRWFPFEFDWVFGCAYRGLPETTGPVLRVIGANMAVRTADVLVIGGFHSDDHDDLDMCHRLLAFFPGRRILYVPSAVVRHYVSEDQLTWRYFWRRCFFVNRSKVRALRDMGEAANMAAERKFARGVLTTGVLTEIRQFVSGDIGGLLRLPALCAGLGFGGLGYSVGMLEWATRRRPDLHDELRHD